MSWTIWAAVVVVIAAVYGLIKRYETRLVLLVSGLVMALISLQPMMAFKQFDKSMTNGSLIIAICSAMGFAAVISITKCDVHLVRLLTKPLKKLGLLLLPACMAVTSIIATAIPSMAGLCASVAPTMIPILVRAGFRPSLAAASVGACLMPAYFNPGVSHNPFIAKLAGMEVIDFIGAHGMMTLSLSIASIILMTVMCLVYGDFKKEGFGEFKTEGASQLPETPNILFALAPLVPVVLLVVFSLWVPGVKISVATAMLIGMIYALVVTRSDPQTVTKKFFDGMGKGYANIMGIIIAAGCFAGGLRAAGVIDALIETLKNSREIAGYAANFGPFLMGVLTGSGDAAGHAFNQAVTPYAAEFGMQIPNLGMVAALSGALGRMCSPIAGATLVIAGMIKASPLEVSKRMTIPMIINLVALGFIFELY